MKAQPTIPQPRALPCTLRATLTATLLSALVLLLTIHSGQGGSATWKSSPFTNDWNTAANWTPATVPNGSSDVATFGASSLTGVSLSASVEVAQIVFSAGTSAFTLSVQPSVILTLSGVGVTNNSGVTQNFSPPTGGSGGTIFFLNNAKAGTDNVYTLHSTVTQPGFLTFANTASADNATIIDHGGTYDTGGVLFEHSSTAGNATFILDGGPDGLEIGGSLSFESSATGGSAKITAAGTVGSFQAFTGSNVVFHMSSNAENASITAGGALSTAFGEAIISFADDASAGNATLTANGGINGGEGGLIAFGARSTGGTAKITLSGNGQLDISSHFTSPALAIGSLAGNGDAFLGQFNLSIGGDSLSTTFSGVLQDGGGAGGTGGALTKIGSGALTLTGDNIYTGGTQITKGILLVNNRGGSGTGTGPVQVRAGTLGGRGTISGTVSVGDDRGQGGFLAPSAGTTKPSRLTIQSALTFQSDGTYTCKVNTRSVHADQVSTNGVTINTGAQVNLIAAGNNVLPVGQVFTVIDNTSANPISGTFSNLPDGGTIQIGSNTFQANYEGGDGNDLTLTVVQ